MRCHGGTETGGVWDKGGRQSDHWQTLQPHIRTDKPRGPDSEWQRTGQAEQRVAPLRPHFRAQINRTNGGERSRPRNPGLQCGEIKPQTSE